MFLKMNADDSEYVDVEGGIQTSDDLGSPSFKRKTKGKAKKKTDMLEEGGKNRLHISIYCFLF